MKKATKLRFFLQLRCLALILIVSGCETAGNTYDTVSSLWDKPIVLPCPSYRILSDASRIVQFREGKGRDLVDINIDGRINDLTLECVTSYDENTKSGDMEVNVTVRFSAKRGPANKTKKMFLPYFISVVDENKNILYREEFLLAGRFIRNQSAMKFLGAAINLELPLTPEISSHHYIIYVGFRLNKEQLRYNRRTQKNDRL